MAYIIREVLNANLMPLTIWCQGMSKVGINLSGTWSGTVSFLFSTDGLLFFPLSMTPFPSGTTVQSATANGNWEVPVKNFVAVQVVFALTSGSVAVTMGTSLDSSYQDAFLVSTSKFINNEVTGGAQNVLTIPAQANRAWRLRSLTVAFSTAPAAAVKLTISDGASAVIWAGYVPLAAGAPLSGGGTWNVLLPPDPGIHGAVSGGGVVNTAGNSMVITLAAPGGSIVSELNAEAIAA